MPWQMVNGQQKWVPEDVPDVRPMTTVPVAPRSGEMAGALGPSGPATGGAYSTSTVGRAPYEGPLPISTTPGGEMPNTGTPYQGGSVTVPISRNGPPTTTVIDMGGASPVTPGTEVAPTQQRPFPTFEQWAASNGYSTQGRSPGELYRIQQMYDAERSRYDAGPIQIGPVGPGNQPPPYDPRNPPGPIYDHRPGGSGGVGPGGPGTMGGDYLPYRSDFARPFNPDEFTYIDPRNFALPGYGGIQSELQGITAGGYRETPRLGNAAQVGLSDYLTGGQRNLMGAYGAPGRFAGQEGELAGLLGDYSRGSLGPDAYGGDTRALIGRLGQTMSGQDSLARMNVREALEGATADQRAMAATARPGSGALAARTAAQNIGRIGSTAASTGARAELEERMAAAGQLGNVLSTARGQDLARQTAERQLQLGAAGQLGGLMSDVGNRDLSRLGAMAGLYGQMGGQELQAGLANQDALNQFEMRRPELEFQNRQIEDARMLEALRQRAALSQAAQAGTMGYEAERSRRVSPFLGQPEDPGFWDYFSNIAGTVLPFIPAITGAGRGGRP